ncbi:hypothetical protein EV426DRAFT_609441, partial [Tirmania nivea]
MERGNAIPRLQASVPETLVIAPSNFSDNAIAAPASTPSSGQAAHVRSKTLSLQLATTEESSHKRGTGSSRFLSSFKYWTGRSGLQSPRLHGFSPREVNAFERKSIVESIPEEGNREGGNEDVATGKAKELVFDIGESGLRNTKSSTANWQAYHRAAPTLLVSHTGSAGRYSPRPDWPVPLLPGAGILSDRLNRTTATVSPPNSDINQFYRSFNRPSISPMGKTTLQHIQESNNPLQQPPVPTVNTELPLLPVCPQPRVFPLLPPSSPEERSRLVSITPSLVAELELEEFEERSFGEENTKGSGIPKAKPRRASGRHAGDVPILSTFSTDTSTEGEPVDEEGVADSLPLQTLPGQLLNLIEIERGNPAMSRKRSLRRKPVLEQSKLAREWATRSSYRSDSEPDTLTYPTRANDRPRVLEAKGTNYNLQAHPSIGPKRPGVHSKPLSAAVFYEGYALRFKDGVYIPLGMTAAPFAIDQSLLYMIVPKKEISDGTGRAYHIIRPNRADQSITSPELELYAYDEVSRAFVATQATDSMLEERRDDRDSISSMKEFQWPLLDEVAKPAEKLKQQPQPQQQDSEKRLPGSMSIRRVGSREERNYNGPLIEPQRSHPTTRSKQAKLLGLGGGTREIGNIEHVKGLERGNSVKTDTGERSSRGTASGEWDYGGSQEDIADDGHRHTSEREDFAENVLYKIREPDTDVMHAPMEVPPKEQERVDSDTDVETGKRRRNMSLNGQSWLETTRKPTTSPAANDTGGWRKAVELSIMKEEEAVSLVTHMHTHKNTTAFNTTPRLPMHKPPEETSDKQHPPVLATLKIPAPSSRPKNFTNISQSQPAQRHQLPYKSRKRYVTLTLNLYRSRSEPPRTTRILIPVSSTVREFDDEKVFGKIKKEYIATTGGVWRTWCGLKGIKWVGINEHLKPLTRLGSHSASNLNSQQLGDSASNTPSPIDPALTRSARLIRFINKPQTARGQRGYMELLRGSMGGTRPAVFSIEVVEDWIPWKVGVVGSAPVVASVVVVSTWYCIGNGGGLVAFQIGILIAILGWGVVAILVLL